MATASISTMMSHAPPNYGVQLSVGACSILAWLPFRRLRAACSLAGALAGQFPKWSARP
jgi:hypothetical protein